MRKTLKRLLKNSRGIVGLEAAIILIAFVIIAAAFSFMVVNQGLFATERGKAVVQEGLKQASTPLSIDGSTFVRTTADGQNIGAIVLPLRAFGVEYVAMWQNETVVTFKVGQNAWANIYCGILYNSSDTSSGYDPSGQRFDDFAGFTQNGTVYVEGNYTDSSTLTGGILAIENSNNDESLDASEKGYLIVQIESSYQPQVRTQITVEIRLEKTAPLSIVFTIPETMPKDTWVRV